MVTVKATCCARPFVHGRENLQYVVAALVIPAGLPGLAGYRVQSGVPLPPEYDVRRLRRLGSGSASNMRSAADSTAR
jgi:hypothetical protein